MLFYSFSLNKIYTSFSFIPCIVTLLTVFILPKKRLLNFMKEKGIVMTAYSPLGSPDRPWAQPDEPVLLEDPRLLEMGKKHGKTPAQVILKWLVRKAMFFSSLVVVVGFNLFHCYSCSFS